MAARDSRRGWAVHAVVYALVMAGLTLLNVLLVLNTDADFLWFPFPLFGWGVGLVVHYLHGVRRAEREVEARQGRVRAHAEKARVLTAR
jgi:hypothetical protein